MWHPFRRRPSIAAFDHGLSQPCMKEVADEKRSDFERVADEVREAGRELTPPRAWLCPSLPVRGVAHRQIHSQDDSSREKPYGRLRVAKNRHDVDPPRGNREQRQSSPVSMTCQIERSTLSAGTLEGEAGRMPAPARSPPSRWTSQWPLSKSITLARRRMVRYSITPSTRLERERMPPAKPKKPGLPECPINPPVSYSVAGTGSGYWAAPSASFLPMMRRCSPCAVVSSRASAVVMESPPIGAPTSPSPATDSPSIRSHCDENSMCTCQSPASSAGSA